MKFKKLFQEVQEFFKVNVDADNEKEKVELLDALDVKIDVTKEKIKNTPSKSKRIKLKKKLNILEELKTKMDS